MAVTASTITPQQHQPCLPFRPGQLLRRAVLTDGNGCIQFLVTTTCTLIPTLLSAASSMTPSAMLHLAMLSSTETHETQEKCCITSPLDPRRSGAKRVDLYQEVRLITRCLRLPLTSQVCDGSVWLFDRRAATTSPPPPPPLRSCAHSHKIRESDHKNTRSKQIKHK